MKPFEDGNDIRYDLDRYKYITDLVKHRDESPDWKGKTLLDTTEIRYVMKVLQDAIGTIAYYRKRNSDPSGRW